MDQKKEHINYWIRIHSRPPAAQEGEPRRLTFVNYVVHFFDNRWPCPPYCMDASGVGQAFTVIVPLLTFFFLLAGWLTLAKETQINWPKLIGWSVIGGALAGFFIGFVFAWKFNRTVRDNHLGIDRDELKTLIREVQTESR